MKKNKREWGWALANYEDGAHGIFNSRKEAVKNAQGYIANELNKLLDPEEKILVGIVKWADPCDHLPEFENILEFIRSQARQSIYVR
jgi:heme-degrading monooxygenase HmoA